jgi:hypothetical protein
MIKPAILLLSSTLLFSLTWAQNVTSKKTVVDNTYTIKTAAGSTDLPFFDNSEDAEKIVTSIMNVMGLESNFKIKEAHVANVEARIRHHQRYILFNRDFVNQVNRVTQNKWASIFILAHEVGHHLEGHTLLDISSRPDIELEADQFAGFVLYKMGASLKQAQLAMYYIANVDASKTHPGRADRLLAIQKGWDNADAGAGTAL